MEYNIDDQDSIGKWKNAMMFEANSIAFESQSERQLCDAGTFS